MRSGDPKAAHAQDQRKRDHYIGDQRWHRTDEFEANANEQNRDGHDDHTLLRSLTRNDPSVELRGVDLHQATMHEARCWSQAFACISHIASVAIRRARTHKSF